MTGDKLSFNGSSRAMRFAKLNADREMSKINTDFSVGDDVSRDSEKQAKIWLEKNKAAIENYNKSIDEHGVFSDKIRCF